MSRRKAGEDATEALSKLNLNANADEEDDDSQSMESDDESYREEAPKSILRRVHGMKKIYVRIRCHTFEFHGPTIVTIICIIIAFIFTIHTMQG